MGLDDYVISEPKLSPDFEQALVGIKAGSVELSREAFDAAEEALGRELDRDEVRNALAEYDDYKDVKALRKLLKGKEKEFDGKGGRGVALAEEIDKLRMVVAVRSSK